MTNAGVRHDGREYFPLICGEIMHVFHRGASCASRVSRVEVIHCTGTWAARRPAAWLSVAHEPTDTERQALDSASLEACTVRSMSASVCAADKNAASNWDGGQYTPRA